MKRLSRELEDHLREAATDFAKPGMSSEFYLNLGCWLGERAHLLLREIDALRAELAGAKERERRAFEAGQEGEYSYDPVAECSDWSHKFPTFEDYEKAEETRRQREEKRRARKIRRQQKEESSG